LLILAAIAPICKKLILGTGTMISHRHPIHLAQAMAGLSTLCDSNIIMGLGLGTFPHEFEAAGYKKTTLQDRANIAKVNAQLCRRFWPVKRSLTKTTITTSKTLSSNRRQAKTYRFGTAVAHGVLPPRGGLLRRLDARTDSTATFNKMVNTSKSSAS